MSVEENLRAIDVLVIVTLWALKFLDSWLKTLFENTSKVIYGEFVDSESFERYVVYLLFVKCALACGVAFIVDAYNHKFFVAFGGMALYTLTPVLALCMCISQKRIFSLLTLTASSVLFVTSPAAFGVVFNQKKSPVRVQIRRLVSIMEFVEGLLLVIIGVTIPEAVPYKRYSMIASWVFVVPFFIFILTILERIRKHTRPERLRERGVVAIFKGIQSDISGKILKTGLSKMNVLFFVLLLLPAFSLTSLGSVVANLKPANDTQFQHPLLKHMVKVGQLTVIPFTEVVVSFVPLPEVLAEMLVLGIAHVLNIIVLTLLVVRMTGGGGKTRAVINFYDQVHQNHTLPYLLAFPSTAETSSLGFVDVDDNGLSNEIRVARYAPLQPLPPPDEKRFVYYILNPTNFVIDVEDDPRYKLFGMSLHNTLDTGTGMIYGRRNMKAKEETISIIGKPKPINSAPPFTKTIKFEERKLYFLIVTGNQSKFDLVIAGDDVDIPEILRKPILIVQNTFVGGSYWGKLFEGDHELQVTTVTGSTIFIDTLADRSKSLSLIVQVGELTLTVRYQGSDPLIKQKLNQPISTNVTIEPATVNMISINVDTIRDRYVFGYFAKVCEKKPPTTTAAPPGPEKPDVVLQTTYTMLGISIGLTSVGYIHFFWMGCPVRLRATLYAWFLASNEILGWFAAEVVGDDIGLGEGIGLLTIAVVTAIWHFVLGWYYEHKIMPDALKQRRLPSTASLN